MTAPTRSETETVVITCTCPSLACKVPDHGLTPRAKADPRDLADAGREACAHLDAAVTELMKARAAWVSRGLPDTNPLPESLDRLARSMTYQHEHLRTWTQAAAVVAERRYADA